jgi:lipid A 3-O-deacylase
MTFLLPLLTVQLVIATTEVQLQEVDLTAALFPSISLTQPTESEEVEDVATTTWGEEGTWRWGIHGGYAEDLNPSWEGGKGWSTDKFSLLGVEFDYFIADKLSLDIGLNILDIRQIGGDTDGFNCTLQLRWHMVAKENWSFFIEGGAGLLFTEHNVPSSGTEFNFTPQAGLGFSFKAENSARWLIGLRWHHISNANTDSTNPGRDSMMLWAGITFPF